MGSDNGEPELLWQPPKGKTMPMDKYRLHVNEKYRQDLKDTKDLQRWSVTQPHDFWIDLYGYLELAPPLPRTLKHAYDDTVPMSSVPPFFLGHDINYAENILFANDNPNAVALIGIREGQDIYNDKAEVVTWAEFREKARQVASALRRCGIKKGDRVGALVATSSWAVILFHAAASIGAIFTSISPELGVDGCVSRLKQVTPSILFVDSDVVYKGKTVSTAQKLDDILLRLEGSIRPQVIVIPVTPKQSKFPSIHDFLQKSNPTDELTFTRVPFNYPLMICYSSGTTGVPKCIVHRHGLIMQVKKISVLHNSLGPGDVIMQYSSTSWVVFYIMCGHLSAGATLVVYNGSPLFPDAKQLLRICERYKVAFLGASPRLFLEIEMSKTIPKREFDLSALRTVYTTGAPLSVEQYKWFYRVFPSAVEICNAAGGTDTATSLLSLDPCGPVYAGEMQVPALGMDVDILDPVTGESIAHTGEAGEMVVRKPFPSMPCFFWGDTDGKIYKAAYFERFDNVDVWAQHDWLSKNPRTGGYTMHGRSDGVLNPSGIRFGSGEIYAIVETHPFTEYISNSLCVGRRRPQDSDEQVFLFLVMKPGYSLTRELRAQIKSAIRNGLSPRHVPKFVLAVPDIPVTINGKKVEIAVKSVISGKDVTPSATVQNPDTIAWFKRFRLLESEPADARL
ncbi:acetoacetate-CoA ligase [Capronia coronata CBS 617.96]|uniref:Acetoacetate-CoA ligase n=1 Tax=Capronia coronata CBS 617.96 TaxID=1182541 RepID=W9YZF9_9EURO|nr:acetoacetate-CoA ligase [Capronia coronata CBS 617.96]EXJ94691.1 acetoacetate-CoA ligase [Capronia coronata CBS 617.96]